MSKFVEEKIDQMKLPILDGATKVQTKYLNAFPIIM